MTQLLKKSFKPMIVGLLSLLVVSLSAQARPKKSSTYDMRTIDLVGMKLYYEGEKMDAFGYEIKLKEDIEDVEDLLSDELGSGQEIISRIFELDQKSSFKNIFVFIAVQNNKKANPKYFLYTVYQNKSGSLFTVDYDITKISDDSLELENGPSDDLQKLRLETGNPLFTGSGPY